MKNRFALITLLFVFLINLFASSYSFAAEKGPVATAMVFWDEMKRVAAIEDPSQRQDVIFTLFNEHFDFERFYELALIDHWNNWTPEQKEKFASRFKDMFINNAVGKFNRLIGKLDQPMRHVAVRKPWGYQVISIAETNRGNLTITTYLENSEQQWKIMDLDIEGALLSRNYRGQFNYILRHDGYEELINRIEHKQT